MGLERARQQKHTLETIQLPMQALQKRYPTAGACEARSILFHEWDMSVPM